MACRRAGGRSELICPAPESSRQNCRDLLSAFRCFSWQIRDRPPFRLALLLLSLGAEEDMEGTGRLREALLRIRTEYVEMPDLKLTARQAQRLWNLSTDVCDTALAVLVREGFLGRAVNGSYVRPGVRESIRLRPASLSESA